MTNLESDGKHISQGLAVLVHEQENAPDWSDKNQSYKPSHTLRATIEPRAFERVFPFFNPSR